MACKGLNFYHGDFRALEDIDLDLHDRQVTALIGPSGCGKSTLLRCCNRMYEPLSRAARDRRNRARRPQHLSASIDLTEFRERVGMVFQKPTPFPDVDLR